MPPGRDPATCPSGGSIWGMCGPSSANPASFGMDLKAGFIRVFPWELSRPQQEITAVHFPQPQQLYVLCTLSKVPREGRTQVSCRGGRVLTCGRPNTEPFPYVLNILISCLRTVLPTLPQRGGSEIDTGVASLGEIRDRERGDVEKAAP